MLSMLGLFFVLVTCRRCPPVLVIMNLWHTLVTLGLSLVLTVTWRSCLTRQLLCPQLVGVNLVCVPSMFIRDAHPNCLVSKEMTVALIPLTDRSSVPTPVMAIVARGLRCVALVLTMALDLLFFILWDDGPV